MPIPARPQVGSNSFRERPDELSKKSSGTGRLLSSIQLGTVGHVRTGGDANGQRARINVKIPLEFDAPRPNPTQRTAVLSFVVPTETATRLLAFDVLGREVARLVDGPLRAGRHEVTFDGRDLPQGTYLLRLEADGVLRTQRLTLTR